MSHKKSHPSDKKTSKAISRQRFLSKSISTSVGALFATGSLGVLAKEPQKTTDVLPIPPSNKILGRGVVSTPYGLPSKFEKEVLRRNIDWLTPDRAASISFTPLQDLHGIITPAGLHFERFHAGAVDIDPDTHLLVLHGLVEKPLKLTLKDLKRLPSHTAVHFLECPANGALEWRGVQVDSAQYTHGMCSCSEWTGVKLTTLMKMIGVKPESTWFYAEGADGSGLQRSIPLPGAKDQYGESLPIFDQNEIYKDVMVAYAQNGEALRPENGYPIRLVVPGCEANMSIKYLRRMKFTNKPLVTYQETRHYTDVTKDGRARQFTLVNEGNSVITYPSPDFKLDDQGYHEIRGLAWSGRGKVKHVDISLDAGKNWKEAQLVQPVMSKCFTRFTFDWEWDGNETVMMSRITDETGYVQPTIMQLREERGFNTIYHKNAIQAWRVLSSGEIENVQIKNV
ncbi:MAG TPA: sulfite dehydrogenase [Leucothrix sp.]|nr:sulfite dehydrogenase [Leucothrix sp.]